MTLARRVGAAVLVCAMAFAVVAYIPVRGEAASSSDLDGTIIIVIGPPIALFTVSPPSGDVTTVFTFDASDSTDVEGNSWTVEVRWDWEDDGTWDTDWSSTKTETRQFDVPGTYTVRLEVRDYFMANTTTRDVAVSELSPPAPVDTTPPTIVHTPPPAVPVGETIRITATVTDDGLVAAVTLRFRGIGSDTFETVAMTLSSGTYVADIPAQERAGVVSYHIEASDDAGNDARSPATGGHSVEVLALSPPSPPSSPSAGGIGWWFFALLAAILLLVVCVVVWRKRRTDRQGM